MAVQGFNSLWGIVLFYFCLFICFFISSSTIIVVHLFCALYYLCYSSSCKIWKHYLFFSERFILVFIATLPFEIRDAASDQKELGTIPLVLKLTIPKGESSHSIAFSLMGIAYFIALLTVKKDSSENITLFWVELIPALGWLYYVLITL